METIATSPEVLSFAKGAIIFLCITFGVFMIVAALSCNAVNKGENIDEDDCLADEGLWINCNTEIIFDNVQMSEN